MEFHLSIRSYNYLSFHQPPEKGKHASCVEHLTNYKTRIQERDLCKTKCKTRENFACIQNIALNFEQDYANKYACHDIGELSGTMKTWWSTLRKWACLLNALMIQLTLLGIRYSPLGLHQ
jgi:hypothetical protein